MLFLGEGPISFRLSVTGFHRWMAFHMDVNPKIGGFPPKPSILMGFSIIFTIHFGVPLFLETPICQIKPLKWEGIFFGEVNICIENTFFYIRSDTQQATY